MSPLRVKQKTALRDAVLEKAKTNALVKRTIDMDVNWAKWPKEDLQYLAAVNSDPISTIEEQDTVPEPMFRGLANTVTGAAGAVVDYTSDLVNPGPDVPNANSFYGGIVGGVRGALGALTGFGASQAEREAVAAERIAQEDEEAAELDGAAFDEMADMMTPGAVSGGSNVFLDVTKPVADGIVTAASVVANAIAPEDPASKAARKEREKFLYGGGKYSSRTAATLDYLDDALLLGGGKGFNWVTNRAAAVVQGGMNDNSLDPELYEEQRAFVNTAFGDPEDYESATPGEFFKGVAGAITGVVSAVADAVVGPPSQSAETIARIQAEVDAEREAERMAIQAEAAEATRLDRMAVLRSYPATPGFAQAARELRQARTEKSVVQQAAELPARAAAVVVDAVAPAPAKSVADEVVKMPVEAASSIANAVVPPARSIQSTKSLAGLDYSRIGFESSTAPAVAKVAAKVTGTTTASSLGPKTKVRLSKSAARAEAERIADAYYTGNPAGDKADRRRRAKRSTTSLTKYAENPAALDFRGSRSKR